MRHAVEAGIHGLIPLQAALIAAEDRPAAATVLAAFPIMRHFAGRVCST